MDAGVPGPTIIEVKHIVCALSVQFFVVAGDVEVVLYRVMEDTFFIERDTLCLQIDGMFYGREVSSFAEEASGLFPFDRTQVCCIEDTGVVVQLASDTS